MENPRRIGTAGCADLSEQEWLERRETARSVPKVSVPRVQFLPTFFPWWEVGAKSKFIRRPKTGPRTRLRNHVEMHTTGLLEGQVPEQWVTDISLHICPVCSRVKRDRVVQMSPSFQQSRLPIHRTTLTPRRATHGRSSLLKCHPRSVGPFSSGRHDKSHL